MSYHITRTEDVEEAREVHKLAFPSDAWVGDDHEYWIARDQNGAVVGFCSAIYWPKTKTVFLSRAAVTKEASGHGLQRRMVYIRLRWARKTPADTVYTYVALTGYASLYNLMRCGFRAVEELKLKSHGRFHQLWFPLKPGAVFAKPDTSKL